MNEFFQNISFKKFNFYKSIYYIFYAKKYIYIYTNKLNINYLNFQTFIFNFRTITFNQIIFLFINKEDYVSKNNILFY